jgi:hypothetical protein
VPQSLDQSTLREGIINHAIWKKKCRWVNGTEGGHQSLTLSPRSWRLRHFLCSRFLLTGNLPIPLSLLDETMNQMPTAAGSNMKINLGAACAARADLEQRKNPKSKYLH